MSATVVGNVGCCDHTRTVHAGGGGFRITAKQVQVELLGSQESMVIWNQA